MAELVIGHPRGADLKSAGKFGAVPAHAGAKVDQVLWRHAGGYEASGVDEQAMLQSQGRGFASAPLRTSAPADYAGFREDGQGQGRAAHTVYRTGEVHGNITERAH